MAGPYGDPRAGMLLERYRQTFGGDLVPVPVESIAEDFLGLRVGERDDLDCSGLLVPAQRRIWVKPARPPRAPAGSASRSPTSWATESASSSRATERPSTAARPI
jgi:hypothetical protein